MTIEQANAAPADGSLRQQIWQGFGLLRQGKFDEAAQHSEQLLAGHPDNPEVLYLASEVQVTMGDAEKALDLISAAIVAAPGQLPLLLKKAEILLMLRRRADARQVVAEAAVLAGNDGQALWTIGRSYSKCNDPVCARKFYERALDANFNHPGLLYDLSNIQFYSGDFDSAEKNLDALLAIAPKSGPALYLRSTLRRQTAENNHVTELKAQLQAGFPDEAAQAACLYALAKELEDLGRTDESFSVLGEAAVVKRRTLQFDVVAACAAIDAIRAAYTPEAMQAQVAGHEEEGAIFIVGMPRTGTTLLERMLDCHSEAKAAGELMDFGMILGAANQNILAVHPELTPAEASLLIDFAALGRDYMAGLRQAIPGSRMVIDKIPINYMYCGLIRKALPKARIIHLVRDPMDCCYAIYKTLFNHAYLFSYALDELAAYYASYHRLMQHWHTVMPGAILDVRYEDLVADTEGQARRILDWCGLDWQAAVLVPSENENPAMTISAAQVREPIHGRSIQSWRKHEAGLAPLKARLVAAGIVKA